MISHNRHFSIAAALLMLIAGCSDSSNYSQPVTEPPIDPEPVTSLDATGIYQGTAELEQGDVALMTVVLGRSGETSITFETDDSEQASIILWGKSEGDEDEIHFSGSDTDRGDSVAIYLRVNGKELNGEVDMASLKGSFSLSQSTTSERASSLGEVAGKYVRQDAIDGQSVLEIDTDGSARWSGACDAPGTISIVDAEVNIYQLELSSDCLDVEALISNEDRESTGDVLLLTGDGGDSSLSIALYRI